MKGASLRAAEAALQALHRGADSEKLDDVRAPRMQVEVEADGHDAVGAEGVCLLLEAGHRELARAVHGLR